MENRLKPGKGNSRSTKSNDNQRRVLLAFGVLALVSLACSIGVLTPEDPIFTPPGDPAIAGIITPVLTFPTDRPQPTVEGVLIGSGGLPEESFATPTPTPVQDDNALRLYDSQAGDTLTVVAIRFAVDPSEISSNVELLQSGSLLPPHTLLIIPNKLANTTSQQKILPDSELVYSPSAVDFDVEAYVNQAGGYLSTYREWLGSTQWTSGAQVIQRIALENSINPRLLLALLEYQSGWVFGQPADFAQRDYPMGQIDLSRKGLYKQVTWAVNHLSVGFYGWREGLLTEISFSDGVTARLAPDLNAGTVALQYYLSFVFDTPGWVQALNIETGLPALYERMYGNPWARAQEVEPLYPPDLTQPRLILPFLIGQRWSYTGGPHGAWEHDGARAALDFAPGSTEPGCVESFAWSVAMAPGLIVRTANGVLVQDLDGDGLEQTGWVLLYLHVDDPQVKLGDWVETSDLLGHPSCEGGMATGTHLHIARKYNGEWIPADGPLPFTLSGWQAHAGLNPYDGTLTRGDVTIPSSVYGSHESLIVRLRDDP
jgi:LasA protease